MGANSLHTIWTDRWAQFCLFQLNIVWLSSLRPTSWIIQNCLKQYWASRSYLDELFRTLHWNDIHNRTCVPEAGIKGRDQWFHPTQTGPPMLLSKSTAFGSDHRFAPKQWQTSLQNNAVSHRLVANLESALALYHPPWCSLKYSCNNSSPVLLRGKKIMFRRIINIMHTRCAIYSSYMREFLIWFIRHGLYLGYKHKKHISRWL